MKTINEIIQALIARRKSGNQPMTLLAVCPNSSAVLEAAVNAAARNRSLMLFAATLNQVDYEASYTGWTPAEFVHEMHSYADIYNWKGPLYPCLDHGGPWLKDLHTLEKLSYVETMEKVKNSIAACVRAGYRLLHIDPTVDRSLAPGQALSVEVVVDRTVELLAYTEQLRIANELPRIDYEVGTEEVHGGMVDYSRFSEFIHQLHISLESNHLSYCWPCLLVAQVGTDLHTTAFKPEAARRLFEILSPLGSLAKGHYTDWVEMPEEYPATGMGAANVGPEFTAEEYQVLLELDETENSTTTGRKPSHFMETLRGVVIESGRWKKWLLPDESGLAFNQLRPERQDWLLKTGSRYIWTDARVVGARAALYHNLDQAGIDAHKQVIERISRVIEKYIRAFNLERSADVFSD